MQEENVQLAKGVETQRDQVESLVSGLEALIADLEGANAIMGEAIDTGDIRKEAMEVENEVGGWRTGSRL